jgi:superoxide dismutase
MLLHEVYFGSLGEGGGGDPKGALAEAIEGDFGLQQRWRAEFVAMVEALQHAEWSIYDRMGRVASHTAIVGNHILQGRMGQQS